MTTPARILTIAGSDPSGGAGVQADLKTITMLGGYGMAAITAITAQNTQGVFGVEPVSATMVAAQIDACVSDIGVDAVKIGMLGSAEIAACVAERLAGLAVPIVFDPVMIATSGGVLADSGTVAAFDRLMGLATLTTPNIPEVEALSGWPTITDELALADAAEAIAERTGAPAILAKGGHWPGLEMYGNNPDGSPWRAQTDDLIFDHLYTLSSGADWQEWTFHAPRIATRHTHGTGCTLASAIACGLGQGLDLVAAVVRGREFVRAALLAAPGFGVGAGPLGHQDVFMRGGYPLALP